MAINGIDDKILFKRHNPSKTPNKKGAINPYATKSNDLNISDNTGVLVVDPNKVVNAYNEIKDRYVKQEDLQIYASLKVYKRGNSSVVYNSSTGARDKDITNEPIYINFLNPLSNVKRSDGFYVNKGKMTSEWTDFFTSDSSNDTESSGYILDAETFGITNISIKINANYHPVITIEFTDIQGRTLFERGNQAENPYNIFYTYPYPNFSLKYKGYYGKAIETSLVLIKSNTRFDPSTGNYNVTAEFQSDVFSILNTFLVVYAYTAPYMFRTDDGDYLGRKILKELYEKQNSEIREEVGDDEFPKYEIKDAPTLWDLCGALKEIPAETLNSSSDTDESVSANDDLIENKSSIENNEINIRDYLNNPEKYRKEILNPNTTTERIIYVPISSENRLNIANNIANSEPIDFFDQIQSINDAVKNISDISIRGQGKNFETNLIDSINKNDFLKPFYGNVGKKPNIRNIIIPELFLPKTPIGNVYDYPPLYLEAFNVLITLIFKSISEVQAVVEDEFVNDQIRDIGIKLGYQPNLSNVLRIIANNMQTFIIMLDIIGKGANNQLKNDILRLNTQNKFSDHEKETNVSIYSAFPNYFKTISEFRDNTQIDKSTLEYPGSESINSNWFEVKFIDEIYDAFTRIKDIANPTSNGINQQTPTSLLTVFQLGDTTLTNYPSKEYAKMLGEAFAKYAIYISYSGLLFRGINNINSSVIRSLADFEVDLMDKNVFSKIQSSQKFVFIQQIIKATSGNIIEDGVTYTNLGNFGIRYVGFADSTVTGSLNVLKPIFSELSKVTTGNYTQGDYDIVINKYNNLLKSPISVNSSGESVGIKNKIIYDIISYKKSENDINLFSINTSKKSKPLKHLVDLRPNYNYFSDNAIKLIGLSEKLQSIDPNKVNTNYFQGLFENMNKQLGETKTSTDIARYVNYEKNDDAPALTFNTTTDDYLEAGENAPYNVVQPTINNQFYFIYNLL
jgi:hypothetical protein